jgi:hypothetical protein
MANTVVSLPVDLNKKTQTYVIKSDGVYDTLTIGYRRHSEYQESCGFRFWVDSLYIARPSTMKASKVIKNYGNESISVTY